MIFTQLVGDKLKKSYRPSIKLFARNCTIESLSACLFEAENEINLFCKSNSIIKIEDKLLQLENGAVVFYCKVEYNSTSPKIQNAVLTGYESAITAFHEKGAKGLFKSFLKFITT